MSYEDKYLKQEWIPVSERLPEERKSVLVYENNYHNSYTAYYDSQFGWITFNPRACECFPEYLDIVAWQPLPAPFKGGEE